MGAKFVIKNEFLNAITYDFCYSLPVEEVKKLSIRYRKMFASKVKTQNFCERASLDERFNFFNEIGLEYALTIMPNKSKNGVALKEIWERYEKEQLTAAQKGNSDLKLYVTTSKQTAFFLTIMGQTINNETYLKSLEYNKTSYHLQNWDRKLSTPYQDELHEVSESANTASNTILNAGLCFGNSKELFGINDVEAKILIFFYQKKHLYLTNENIYDKFTGHITNAKSLRALKRLFLNGYIQKHIDWQKEKKTITAEGIRLVGELISKILKQNNF